MLAGNWKTQSFGQMVMYLIEFKTKFIVSKVTPSQEDKNDIVAVEHIQK